MTESQRTDTMSPPTTADAGPHRRSLLKWVSLALAGLATLLAALPAGFAWRGRASGATPHGPERPLPLPGVILPRCSSLN